MAEINFGRTLTLKQAATVTASVPENRFFWQGEPGIGKSAALDYFRDTMPHYMVADPIDAQSLDLGDTAMPMVDRERKVTEYAPNARFRISEAIAADRPVLIMIDEFTKAMAPVQNMLHPLLEVKPRLGDLYLPKDSIVFLTGNLSTDGVGDNLKAHTRNRLTVLNVRKPSADEFIDWAVSSGRIDPVVLAWVRAFPHAMASYTDGDQDGNPYIYNPKAAQFGYVSPRSLERASNIVRRRRMYDAETLTHALKGTIGEAGARDMENYVAYADQIPSWDDVVNDPKKTKVPESAGACAVMVFGAVAKVTKDTFAPAMAYLERFEPEWQTVFALNVAKSPDKQAIAFSSNEFRQWLQRNEDLL